MSMKKTGAMLLMICFAAAMGTSFAGCGGGGTGTSLGEHEKGERTEITFLCDGNRTSETAWEELVAAYNDGAGYEEDNVYVTVTIRQNASSPSASVFTRSEEYANNVVAVNDGQNVFQSLAIKRDARRAPDGYFLNLQPYADADEDFGKNTIPENLMNWFRMTYNPNAKQGAGQEKHVVGAGQPLLAVPYGTNPHFNWYNEKLFKAQGINIISCEEEALAEKYPGVQPHGYAEYKEAPFSGAVQSENLAGEMVYKVFNNRIGMNWEEQRYIMKCFTKSWNPEQATTDYGFASEYWFNYGWSVGGDVMGFDGEEYDFTLLDKNPNYIVTKDGTVINGTAYAAGEIVRYEDRVNQADIASMDGVYAIPSQYDAVKEYVSMQVSPDTTVDVSDGISYKGYGVATPEMGSVDNWFNTEQLAMKRGNSSGIAGTLESKNAANFNICPAETYRKYEGGSVYYDGAETFENEYLKVIGETYDGEEYTGELKVVDGTPIVGNSTTASISQSLVIPACSDPDKYQAAWDFISWVATEGQQYIAKTRTIAPAAADVAYGENYAGNSAELYGQELNLYAVAMASENAGRGDWGYFESGQWVTDWANDFNNYVRYGRMSLADFLKNNENAAKDAINNMYCVIEGIR